MAVYFSTLIGISFDYITRYNKVVVIIIIIIIIREEERKLNKNWSLDLVALLNVAANVVHTFCILYAREFEWKMIF